MNIEPGIYFSKQHEEESISFNGYSGSYSPSVEKILNEYYSIQKTKLGNYQVTRIKIGIGEVTPQGVCEPYVTEPGLSWIISFRNSLMVENINGLTGQQFSYEQDVYACAPNGAQGIQPSASIPGNYTSIFFITPTKKRNQLRFTVTTSVGVDNIKKVDKSNKATLIVASYKLTKIKPSDIKNKPLRRLLKKAFDINFQKTNKMLAKIYKDLPPPKKNSKFSFVIR